MLHIALLIEMRNIEMHSTNKYFKVGRNPCCKEVQSTTNSGNRKCLDNPLGESVKHGSTCEQ